MHRLIDWLDQQATSLAAAGMKHLEKGAYLNAFSSIMSGLLCDRDAMLATYLWGSSQRSKEAGTLKLEDFTLPRGQTALPDGMKVGLCHRVWRFMLRASLSCLVAGACVPQRHQAARGPPGHGACGIHPGGRPPWAEPVHLSPGPAHAQAGACLWGCSPPSSWLCGSTYLICLAEHISIGFTDSPFTLNTGEP